ncbi:MAG: DedA family protein [Clostridium sp.]|uniref:DedA family protein n=1 Tax=Clostridium sp. TaxID=1506 RepID=UPI003F33B749
MFEEIVSILNICFSNFGLLGIFIIISIEHTSMPISSELALLFLGVLIYIKMFSYLEVIIITIIAGLIGSSVAYYFGYFGRGKIYSLSNKKYTGVKALLQEFEFWERKCGRYALVVCRILPMTRKFISVWAGLQKVKFIDFLVYSFLGITIWNTSFIIGGYFLTEKIHSIEGILNKCYTIGCVSIAFTFVYFYFKNKKRLNKKI